MASNNRIQLPESKEEIWKLLENPEEFARKVFGVDWLWWKLTDHDKVPHPDGEWEKEERRPMFGNCYKCLKMQRVNAKCECGGQTFIFFAGDGRYWIVNPRVISAIGQQEPYLDGPNISTWDKSGIRNDPNMMSGHDMPFYLKGHLIKLGLDKGFAWTLTCPPQNK